MRREVLERHYLAVIKDDWWGLVNTQTKVFFNKAGISWTPKRLSDFEEGPILDIVLIVCVVCVCVQRETLRTRTRLTATQTTTRLAKMRPSCAASSNGSCRGIVRPSPMSRSRASRKVMAPHLFVRPLLLTRGFSNSFNPIAFLVPSPNLGWCHLRPELLTARKI